MRLEFISQGHPSRVVFGAGSIQHLEREIEALGSRRVLVLCSADQGGLGQEVASSLGDRAVSVFDGAAMHVPVEVAKRASELAAELGADCTVAAGGGSTIGLAKAIALERGLPILAIPTTYAGSEMTPIYGLTKDGVKQTGRDPRVLPRTVIYDPDLTLTLPIGLSVTSAINAIAHAAEGLYARDGNPIMDLMAEEGIRSLGQAVPALKANDQDREARARALYGAWLCGAVLGTVGMALHHKLCHTLGGSFDLPHAAVHTVILPHAIAYNAQAAPHAIARIARALGAEDAAGALFDLARKNDAPVALRDIGMPAAGLDEAARLACANPYWNPRPADRDAVRGLLQRAYEGARPCSPSFPFPS